MPPARLNLIAILCLFCTAWSHTENSGVLWRDVGGTITIQCRTTETNKEFLNLKKGLKREFQVLYMYNNVKNTIATKFMDRLQVNGAFPNVDIHINNLTTDDTGPFWCDYKRFDEKSRQSVTEEGEGSVLLVVTDAAQQCDQSNASASTNLVLVSVVISAALLLGIIVCFVIWIIHKTKALSTTVKSRRAPNNDVYEDMRGTLRR